MGIDAITRGTDRRTLASDTKTLHRGAMIELMPTCAALRPLPQAFLRATSACMILLGLAACSGSSAAPPDPAAPQAFNAEGCTPVDYETGQTTVVDIEFDGLDRSYRLFLPTGYDSAAPTPLTLNWHGLTSTSSQQEAYTGTAIAEERGYILAFPMGIGNAFNGGGCCSQFGNPPHSEDDVGFARAIVDDIASQFCVDRRRIYSTGMSNGGYMSERLACNASDLFAAVAPVSALGYPVPNCEPGRPVPLLAFNGTEDPLVSYDGSTQSAQIWAARNGCDPEPVRAARDGDYCERWLSCTDGAEVEHCTIVGMEHCWPSDTQDIVLPGFCATGGLGPIDANNDMYDFFAAHPMVD
ncbi:MAG: PHB depolymerase family esterase [Candidatus Binatia bacterium]|nr:PHB depolymerase family esterase [Candidatus Binatia bacterium]